MRRLLLSLAFILLAIPIPGMGQQRPPAGPDTRESRNALVIGNANYKDAPLANPVNDARAVARALNESGFQVRLRTNLTQVQMRRAIREFGDELHAKQGVGLFYFAGHGVQISNRNFLIPVGADIQREYEVEDQAVDASAVLSMMQSARARVNIVILDACRNNPFIRDLRTTVNGLAPMQAPAGTLVAFSTAPGQTAIDGTGQYGLYTEHLVENLTVPGLKIEDVFKNVRVGVQRASSGRQIPWENTSLTGDFYFRAPAVVAAPERAAAPAVAAASTGEIERAVQDALRKREEEEAIRRSVQQGEIERAVMSALRRREEELAAAQGARTGRENRAAQDAIDRLSKELAELRALRETEKAQAAQVEAARGAALQSSADQPAQVALAAPSAPRAQPPVSAGGRIERPEIRVGDQWKYQVTDGFTSEKSAITMEVVRVTESAIYTHSGGASLASLDFATTSAGALEVWDRNWNQLRLGSIEYSPFYPSLQFPLEGGKKWAGNVKFDTSRGLAVVHDITAEVVGWERIVVPAGTFESVKITLRGTMFVSGGGFMPDNGAINDTFWYSPAVRQFVRKEFQHTAFGAATGSGTSAAVMIQRKERWELIEHKPN